MNNTEINIIIQNLFKIKKYTQTRPLEDEIYSILTPSYFRQGKMEREIEKLLRYKIKQSINQKKPITLVIAFGGYKNGNTYSQPHIDWAEIFHLSFLYKTLFPITQIYKPGLHLEFTLDGEAMSIIDNIKRKDIQLYYSEFIKLLKIIKGNTSSNLTFNTTTFIDYYNFNKTKEIINKKVIETVYNKEIHKLITQRIRHAKNNFIFDGEENLTDNPNKQKPLENSVLKHKYWLDLDFKQRQEYLEGGINIPIVHRKGIPGCYAIKSYKGSVIQFWEGEGVIVNNKKKHYPTIISPHQEKVLQKETIIDSPFNTINKHLGTIKIITL